MKFPGNAWAMRWKKLADACFAPLTLWKMPACLTLVRMKLTSFRDKDRVHLRDLLDVGLVDASWLEQVPTELRSPLNELLDNPEG
jgi:hypothetical protein